jgi:hypothetical protein
MPSSTRGSTSVQESSLDERPVWQSKLVAGLNVAGEVLGFLLYAVYSYIRLIVHFVLPPKMKSLDGEIFLVM